MAEFKVKLDSVDAGAKNMKNKGQVMHDHFVSSKKLIANDMHNIWKGKRYKEFVESFNSILPDINKMLELVYATIPMTIWKIADNYDNYDGTSLVSPQNYSHENITAIDVPNDEVVTQNVDEATKVKNRIKNELEQVATKDLIDYKNLFDSIQWSGTSHDKFVQELDDAKRTLIQNINKINEAFDTCINNAIKDAQSVEQANSVN